MTDAHQQHDNNIGKQERENSQSLSASQSSAGCAQQLLECLFGSGCGGASDRDQVVAKGVGSDRNDLAALLDCSGVDNEVIMIDKQHCQVD